MTLYGNRQILIFLLLVTFFAACNNTGETAKNIEQKNFQSTDSLTTPKTNVLTSNVAQHTFSDTYKKDTFKLTLSGSSILDGNLTFKIVDFNNAIIFSDTFPSSDLLNDQADVIPTPKQKEDSILKRVRDFFNEKRFVQPAITSTDPYDEEINCGRETWENLIADATSIGFIYSHGYESSFGIVYSKRDKRVVQYFASD